MTSCRYDREILVLSAEAPELVHNGLQAEQIRVVEHIDRQLRRIGEQAFTDLLMAHFERHDE